MLQQVHMKMIDEIELSYEDVESLSRRREAFLTLIIGDFNAKVGKKLDENEDVVGLYGEGERNERGQRLIEFASRQNTIKT